MSFSTRVLALAVVACATLAAPAQAQSKKELVNKILLLQQPGVEALAKGLAERPALEMTMAVRPYVQAVPAEKREAVVKAIDADIKKYVDEAVPLLREKAIALAPSTLGAELEANFNEAELKQLITWFESPVVKRFNGLVPNMQRAMSEKLVAETRGQIEPKIKTLESQMAKHLGVPANGGAPGGAAPAAGAASPIAPAPAPGMPGNRGGK